MEAFSMKRNVAAVSLGLMLAMVATFAAVSASPVPEYALDKDFQNCMGGETVLQSPQRAQYCNCMRQGMKNWDLDTYGNVALEQSKARDAQQVPAQIAEMARGCLANALH
jgi:hypothetical protein